MRTLLVSLVAFLALSSAAVAQTPALTYQGRLKNGGQPASGLHDLRFRLFDAAQGGSQPGSTQCLNNLSVTDGLFTASIDFGQQFASPDGRFLEIQVREDRGKGCGDGAGFVTLNPRQPLTATPLASHANSAFALDAADGGPADAVFVDDQGRVGIGTQTPGYSVTVAAPGPTIALQDTDGDSTQVGYLSYRNSDNVEMAWVDYGTPGSPHFSMVNARAGGNIALWPFSRGVGIATDEPQAALDVRGDIRRGSSGQFLAAAGEENLRIVRGFVRASGEIEGGRGFTVSHVGTGEYHIIFDTPFGSDPTMTASTEYWFGIPPSVATPDTVVSVESWVVIKDAAGGFLADRDFHFIAVGPR